MDAFLLTVYLVLLLMALIYAGIVIYHVAKYRQDDLPPRQGYYALKILWLYLIVVGVVLIASISLAVVMTLAA
ncbi:hypothetical protein A2V68_00275 [candidate division Kazan bacterium RBG_13_50_9]|uniref:Uncharacterized protein n=1 Tax=candidate division Kazan bacterium RBG_13_50_9 TaxID=1798535 RepID=A0A1F4NTJ0_UNCK3|nr:MAG: hypothetical protein A2V68_00275 [candidate division Kazan bacterium RBG_13_50_9]